MTGKTPAPGRSLLARLSFAHRDTELGEVGIDAREEIDRSQAQDGLLIEACGARLHHRLEELDVLLQLRRPALGHELKARLDDIIAEVAIGQAGIAAREARDVLRELDSFDAHVATE